MQAQEFYEHTSFVYFASKAEVCENPLEYEEDQCKPFVETSCLCGRSLPECFTASLTLQIRLRRETHRKVYSHITPAVKRSNA